MEILQRRENNSHSMEQPRVSRRNSVGPWRASRTFGSVRQSHKGQYSRNYESFYMYLEHN
jgi:hypothetical protein